jgi:soluble lytic murein transglycosylase-like protein
LKAAGQSVSKAAQEGGRSKTTPAADQKSNKKRVARKRMPPATKPVEALAWRRAGWLGMEVSALLIGAMVSILAALGQASARFGGVGFWSSLLPFALVVLALALVGALLLWGWLRLRVRIAMRWPLMPAWLAALMAVGALSLSARDEFARDLRALRTLVGGVQEAERTTVSHQVYAAYRRADLAQVQKLLGRAEAYLPAIQEAAKAHRMDEEVLVGVAAAESSFLPRDSKDGGRGLFQITAPPREAERRARERLGVGALDLADPRHNAHVAAATLSGYLHEMRGDLFLGLLAYNIGPRNGGLLSIMRQYGARDFATIQPYLQNLPRDYPIRVLSAALAYRLWKGEGRLPRYEEGDNALRIQKLGIPGLDAG